MQITNNLRLRRHLLNCAFFNHNNCKLIKDIILRKKRIIELSKLPHQEIYFLFDDDNEILYEDNQRILINNKIIK